MQSYISTRGTAPRLSFFGATLAGLAEDGGLYVPELCPKIDPVEFDNMSGQHYLEIAWRVMLPFVSDDLSSDELIRLLRASYKEFDHKEIAPLREMGEGLYLQELFHGPTLAFKDMALQFLGRVFAHILEKRGERVTIVGATSGDTGSAAIEAFRGRKEADIFILHPLGRVSEVQRRQMTTVLDANVHNIAVEGSFDDCQRLVKALFADIKFREEARLSAVNSINWARILAQIAYYVYGAARLRGKSEKPVSFCVPTGNFGNVYAGYVALSMGIPIKRLIVATNRNDILHRFFETGRMKQEEVAASLSPSMDIQVSSNFERLLFDIFGRQAKALTQTMQHFQGGGPFHLEDPVMDRVRSVFASGRESDEETLDVMRRAYEGREYVMDPHTAVGFGVAEDYSRRHPDENVITLATAHPAKFPEAVKRTTGFAPELPERLRDLYERPERYETLPADLDRVRDFIRSRFQK